MITSTEKTVPLSVRLAGGLLLGAAGAAMGYLVSGQMRAGEASWEDGLAVLMGVMLLALGLVMTYVLVSRPATVPKGCGVLQIIAMIMAGILFLLPVLVPDSIAPVVAMAGIVAALVAQTLANVLLWRRADEMLRQLMLETSAISFWLLQLAFFTYAAAERLGLVGGVSAWGMAGVMIAIYLLASTIAAARKGLK